MSESPDRLNWEFFLYGEKLEPLAVRVTLRQRIIAVGAAAKALILLKVKGWPTSHRFLSKLSARKSSLANLAPLDSVRLARSEIVYCQLVVRLFAPNARCLQRSVPLTAYLLALGLPAQLVVGRTRFPFIWLPDFHAWTELQGLVVNDYIEDESAYTVLHRIPCLPNRSEQELLVLESS